MMRSALFVPADSERKLEKGCGSGADALFLDLEDSVALDRKPLARDTLAAFLAAPPEGAPPLHVRINAFDTGFAETDLAAVMPMHPVGIVLPKSCSGADVTRLDAMLRVHEARSGAPDGSTLITAIVTETAAATLAAGTYARCSPRLRAMTWGAEDLAADLGVTRQRDARGRYTDAFRFARVQALLGAIAAGVQPLDTVFPDFRNEEGFREECEAAAADGFTGKMAIHPAQVPIINAAFTPTPEAVERARRIVQAFAEHPDAGVLALDGAMIDRPHLRQAEALLARLRPPAQPDR